MGLWPEHPPFGNQKTRVQRGPERELVGRGNANGYSSRANAYRVHRASFAVVADRLMYDTRSPRTFITITNMVFH
jgi:hypothetical protein